MRFGVQQQSVKAVEVERVEGGGRGGEWSRFLHKDSPDDVVLHREAAGSWFIPRW
jgi:hypothetical protein